MLLRLFATFVALAISYECEVWVSHVQGRLNSDAKKLQGVQLAILCSICGRFPVSVPSDAVLAEVAEDPCILKYLVQLVQFVGGGSQMHGGSLHRNIPKNNVLDAFKSKFAKPAAGS